jgi:hypothetical protein
VLDQSPAEGILLLARDRVLNDGELARVITSPWRSYRPNQAPVQGLQRAAYSINLISGYERRFRHLDVEQPGSLQVDLSLPKRRGSAGTLERAW